MADCQQWEAHNQLLIQCRLCPRLVAWREEISQTKRKAWREEAYWGKPVTGFGDTHAKILAVGLAPGAHGSNRTGRMFTGDASGDFLYRILYETGFASQPTARSKEDALSLTGLFISAVCRCAPPDNKPTPSEIKTCLPYLIREMNMLNTLQGIVALGKIAFDEMIRLYRPETASRQFTFSHGAFYPLGENKPWLLVSYHPSRQNTQTGRLTPDMFMAIWEQARGLIK